MLAGIRKVVRWFPAAALALLLVDLIWIPMAADEAPAILPPAGEVLAGSAPYTFAMVGDNRGNANVYDTVIKRIQQDGAAFVLHGGDLVKHCTANQYRWLLHEMAEQDLKVPFCPVPGNHDVLREPDPEAKVSRLLYERSFGQRHYWFAYADTLFVALDTSGKALPADELAWLDRTLALNRSRYGTCIVFSHVPPRNPQPGGGHDLGADGEKLAAVLAKWNVTAMFASHVHSYAEDRMRGVPIYISGGAGGDLQNPGDKHHYLLCRMDSDGTLTVQKKDVPFEPNRDYPEYVARARLGRQALRAVSAALLLISIGFAWFGRHRPSRA